MHQSPNYRQSNLLDLSFLCKITSNVRQVCVSPYPDIILNRYGQYEVNKTTTDNGLHMMLPLKTAQLLTVTIFYNQNYDSFVNNIRCHLLD